MKTLTAIHVSGVLALLLLILTEVSGNPNLNNSPTYHPESGVLENIHAMIRNQTRACENLDSKLNQVLQKQELLMEALLVQRTGTSLAHPASSCKHVLELDSTASSGYYYIGGKNDSSHLIYCDMTTRCGGDRGWMQLMMLDMTNLNTINSQCPRGLTDFSYQGKRVCGRAASHGGCSSVNISSHGIDYSKVCGKVIAYQYSSPDGFTSDNIDGTYLDGVSLTHGRYPRKHIWSFAALHDEEISHGRCPCINRYASIPSPPNFVGNDYFCDAGSEDRFAYRTFYGSDPLWDGRGCGRANSCCTRNPRSPLFVKELGTPTDDNIEMRLCLNQDSGNENVLIENVEIYVQ